MKKYEVDFVREYYETIVVEAGNEVEAREKANEEWVNIVWELKLNDLVHEGIAQITEITEEEMT